GIFVVFGAALLRAQDPPADPAELARELRRTPPLEPANALRSFQIREGFQIQLVAAEPDVVDPVALAFDEEGRMFVVEMRDYPFEPGKGQSPEQIARAHSGRVRVLEDVDGDARVDRSKIYADAISWPTGILCYRGGTFVTAAPDVLYLKDEDGDGVAERREVVFTGFARNNVQGLVNSLCWGLDNHVWGSSSSNGGEIRRTAAGRGGSPDAPVGLRGRDFRFLPGDSAAACGPMEPAAGGGQFGMCFDDWGDRFVCNNSSHVRAVALETRYFERNPVLPAPACIVDIAEDGGAAPVHRSSAAEPWRLVRTRWRAASAERSRFAATELVPTGFFTSATGIHVYRGDAFPPEFRGSVFIGDVGGNLVHRKILVPKGSIFTACRPPGEVTREFLTSTDNWFRPVAFADGPDGALYVLDMYRETIEHPDSIPESIKSHVDLKSGDDRGRIYRIVPEGYARQPRPRLGAATVSELVGCLDSPSAWWRETAQRLLVERHARDAAEPLRSLAREGTHPRARLHALWTMDGLDVLSRGDLERAFTDRDPGVREAALRLAERFLKPDDRRDAKQDASLVAPILRLAGDPALRVRRQAALALGFVASPEAAVALAAVARRRPLDDWTRAAVLSSCREHAADVLTALSSGSEALAAVNGAGSEDDLRGTLALLSGLAETAVYQRSALRGVLEAAATLGVASPVAPGTPGGASGAGSQPTGTLDAAIAVLLGAGEGLRRN
ncbi:MAG TPA: PVC-type heme-binding CxxCH protein, partial [Planctomycetota bacterium]|nr:PVC-type heme-binding CxxCH protein [Planctomycetota bacterium]